MAIIFLYSWLFLYYILGIQDTISQFCPNLLLIKYQACLCTISDSVDIACSIHSYQLNLIPLLVPFLNSVQIDL